MHSEGVPLVSVIIICYNQPVYCYETIDSILRQDYPNIELIICDDNSQSFDAKGIENYINSHRKSNITNVVICQNPTNVGTVKNCNRGISLASGTYIKIIAGDDLLFDETVISAQVKFLEKTDFPIVTGKVQHFADDGTRENDFLTDLYNTKIEGLFDKGPKEILKILHKEKFCPFATQACCFRKSYFDETGLFDDRYVLVEDTPFVFRLLTQRTRVGFVDRFVVLHRVGVGVSANSELFSKRKAQYYRDLMNIAKYQQIPHPELYGRIRPRLQYKLAKFRLNMSLTENMKKKCLLVICNADALLFYFFGTPQKTLKILRRFVCREKNGEG